MRRKRTEKMVGVAMLAAIGYLLMFLEFPVLPAFAYMKIDFSDIPVMIGAFVYGPLAAVIIAFVRSLLHFITTGGDVSKLIGDLAGFVASVAFVLPIYYVSRQKNNRVRMLISLAVGVISLTVVMTIANYFVITPLYMKVLNFPLDMSLKKYILLSVLPFNLIKGILVSVVFLAVHSKLLPWFQKRNIFTEDNVSSVKSK